VRAHEVAYTTTGAALPGPRGALRAPGVTSGWLL